MKGSKTKKGTTAMEKKDKSETVKNSTKEVDVLGENLNAHNDSTSTDDSESISSVSISSENLQPKKDLTPAITLSCFRTWNMEKLEHCFKNYNSKLRKKKTGPQISLPKLSKFEQFQPWWDEFSKLPKESSKKVQVDSSKGEILFISGAKFNDLLCGILCAEVTVGFSTLHKRKKH